MNIGQYFIEAMESLLGNKMRSGLTILGIVIGVAAVISMMAIGQGAQDSISSSIQGIGTNLLFISSGNRNENVRVSYPEPLLMSDVEALSDPAQTPDVAYVTGTITTNSTVNYKGTSTSTSVVGVSTNYAVMRNLIVVEGEFISDETVSSRAAVAVIGTDVATNLFNRTEDIVGETIRISGQLFQVIGVLESKGGSGMGSQDNQILIPITTAQSRLARRGDKNQVDQILVSAASAEQVEAATAEVTAVLRASHELTGDDADDFSILTQEDLLDTVSSVTGTLTMFLGGVGGISLLVGGIGIMNIMLVSVTERTREIGLRKAIGARRWDIRAQFLMESSVLSLLGGLVGIVLAWGISMIVGQIAQSLGTTINPVISLDVVLLATLFSAAVGLFFGYYPANRASNLQPVEALRTE